jgi:hypothetical protein
MGLDNPSADSHERIDESIGTSTRPPGQASPKNGTAVSMTIDDGDTDLRGEEQRPPLPQRPPLLQTSKSPATTTEKRPTLLSKPTTAVSSVDIQTLSFPDGSRGTFSTPASRAVSESISGTTGGQTTPSRKLSRSGSEVGGDDNASLMSYAPTLRANGDLASLLDEGLNAQSPAWRLLTSQTDSVNPFESVEYEDRSLVSFEHEFDELEAVQSEGNNEGQPAIPLPQPILTQCFRRASC